MPEQTSQLCSTYAQADISICLSDSFLHLPPASLHWKCVEKSSRFNSVLKDKKQTSTGLPFIKLISLDDFTVYGFGYIVW